MVFFQPPLFIGAAASSGPQVVITNNPQTDTVDRTAYTFSLDISTAAANRRVFVPFHWIEGFSSADPSTVTINGVSASIRQRSHNGGVTGLGAAVASAVVASGSGSVSVVITMDGGVSSMVADTVVAYGLGSSVHDFVTAENAGTASDISGQLDTALDGFLIAVYTGSTNANTRSITWIGATEVYDFDIGGGTSNQGRASLAVGFPTVSQSNLTVTADLSIFSADSGNDLVVESWAPSA